MKIQWTDWRYIQGTYAHNEPIRQDEYGEWWFRDETQTEERGPYTCKEECEEAHLAYEAGL